LSTAQLAILDIDGTLTATNAVDDECFLRATSETLGLDCAPVDWSDAPHVTDSAITSWFWTRHRGRRPDAQELIDFQRRFVSILTEELARSPERFAAIAGAAALIPALQSAGWHAAIATGGWRTSAMLKLRAAGLEAQHLPMACANDAESREDIVRLAWRGAERLANTSFDRVVSVGDAAWDVRTARSLGLPFVGIGTGEVAARLRAAGATTILPHFDDGSAVLAALSSASPPSLPRIP
jgi:phosphoglycolate phosphatase-like HAD superfamily hydrolase